MVSKIGTNLYVCEHPTKGYVLLKRLTLVLDGLISGVASNLITCIKIFRNVLYKSISLKNILIEILRLHFHIRDGNTSE